MDDVFLVRRDHYVAHSLPKLVERIKPITVVITVGKGFDSYSVFSSVQLYTPLFLRQFEYPNRFFWTNLAE